MSIYEVYLAGAMEYTKDGGVAWRETVEQKLKQLGIKVFNPASNEHGVLEKFGIKDAKEFLALKRTELDRFLQCMRSIINYDMDAIDRLDCILVYVTKGLSGGTIGEITHAYRNLGIPVFAVLEPGLQAHEVSGWVLGCLSEVFTDFDSAIEAVKKHKAETEELYSQVEELT